MLKKNLGINMEIVSPRIGSDSSPLGKLLQRLDQKPPKAIESTSSPENTKDNQDTIDEQEEEVKEDFKSKKADKLKLMLAKKIKTTDNQIVEHKDKKNKANKLKLDFAKGIKARIEK